MKSFLESAFPSGVRLYRRVRDARYALIPPGKEMEKVFTGIYRNNAWADQESVSGRGATLARTEVIRRELPALLESVGAKSLLDAPCGDFNWMRGVDLRGVRYTGVDVVRELIARNRREYGGRDRHFLAMDITSDRLPKVDVILCRDCLIHLSFRHTRAAISNFKESGSKFLLATTHTAVRENTDIATGGWRNVNLLLPPYDFPEPARQIVEAPELGKNLGLWRLEDL